MGVGVINWGGGNSAVHGNCALQTFWHTKQCATIVRCKLAAHIVYQNSVRQLCAANLRRTLCTRTVCDNCALQTCGAHCVPVQCVTTVRRKLAVHIVCQNSARQLCVAYLWRTLWARTVRQKRNLHTKNAFAANLPQLWAANLPQVCGMFAAYMYQRPYILVRVTKFKKKKIWQLNRKKLWTCQTTYWSHILQINYRKKIIYFAISTWFWLTYPFSSIDT